MIEHAEHDGSQVVIASLPADAAILLDWMRRRAEDGVIYARAISDSAPRAFRRRADADAVLATLIEAGLIAEICKRPRAFRIDDEKAKDLGHGSLASPEMSDMVPIGPVPLSEVRQRFDESAARHTARGLSGKAARYMAGRTVHDGLRRDVRLAWPQSSPDRCCFCDELDDGWCLRVHHGRLLHARCFAQHRSAVAQVVDRLIVAAIE